jgi:hypothetical protein
MITAAYPPVKRGKPAKINPVQLHELMGSKRQQAGVVFLTALLAL